MGYNSGMELQQLLAEIKEKRKHTKNRVIVGRLDDAVVRFLEERGVAVHTREIYLTHKGLSHLARDSKKRRGAGLSDDDILLMPEIIKNGQRFFDESGNWNLLFCNSDNICEKYIKIVVDTKAYDKKLGNVTLVKTAGYVFESNLKGYTKIR